jgi:DNA-directed RNA polymerase specialized sigma24 family protein
VARSSRSRAHEPASHSLLVNWTYEGCDQEDERQLQQHWRQLQVELEGLAAGLAEPPEMLRLIVEKNSEADDAAVWNIHAALYGAGWTALADGTADSAEAALLRLRDNLAERLNRNSLEQKRAARRRRSLMELQDTLVKWWEAGRSEAFLSFLVPAVVSMSPTIRRELRLRERQETLARQSISVADVIDEVLVMAWDQFDRRPGTLPLSLWLLQLAQDALLRFEADTSAESLDQETAAPTVETRGSREDEWIEQVDEYEQIELSELLPGDPGLDVWEDEALLARQRELGELLGQFTRERRQALILNIVHGFEPGEIADFQGRGVSDVKSDLAEGTEHIHRTFAGPDMEQIQESFARQSIRDEQRRHARK